LLRNSIDHGIETPEERVAAGKPPEGKIRLEAKHRAGMLSITLSDDGRGVDLDAVKRKVAERKMASPEMVRDMSQSDVMDFLFLPGFSTAPQVTEISGRGVGLDVVHAMLHEVGGTVRASTETGKGVTFQLQLPLTLSVIRTLLVEVSGEPYAFPLARIDRSIKIPADKVKFLEGRPYFCLEGENVGLVAAHQVLELQDPRLKPGELSVVVISDRLNRYGVVVDRFLGERELVVRPLDPRLGKVPDISAAAVMVDGSPVLILDVEDLVRSIDGLLSGGRLKKLAESSAPVSGRKRVLVVDDSITVREVERKLLQAAGYDVEVAVNGMDGWNQVRTSRFDLVITDIDMPRMNGFELVRLIKADASLKRLPVMIVSYKEREEDRRKGLDAGANFYLTKSSFHDETLIHAVTDLIGEGQV
jgi:two-component system sensor histidine kinase and response regulator WspE